MKMQNIPLDDIVPNPWRDKQLHPMDADHVRELRESIDDHGFFGGVKGRRRNGKVEIGCGHMRIEAARKAKLESVPIFVGDMDDDAMLRLMVDENALQSGANPSAVLNEVAAVTRRLIDGLLDDHRDSTVPVPVAKAFETKGSLETARGKLRTRITNPDADVPISYHPIRRYLGDGNPERSHRGERQIREAISALKQAGRYDTIVDEAVSKYIRPVADTPASTTIAKTKPRKPRRAPVLDERCANVFPSDHQFNAFREAVTTPGALKVIPVDKQLALAKEIMGTINSQFNKKQAGAPYIKRMVQAKVQEGLAKQRDIDKEEKERYLAEQREERIEDELRNANAQLRGLVSCIARLIDLAEQFPAHPKLGGFSDRLDTLVAAIKQFSRKLK